MTRAIILTTLVAVTLMTGLMIGSIPTSDAQMLPSICPPFGKFVEIDTGSGPMGPFEISSYTYTTTTDPDTGMTTGTYMFTHEPGEDLSPKILAALKSGSMVDLHITTCKKVGNTVKTHTVWLSLGMVTSVSETAGDDDDFPAEKVSGTFTEIEKMTTKTMKGKG